MNQLVSALPLVGAMASVEMPRMLARDGHFGEALNYYLTLASQDRGRLEAEWRLHYRRGDLRTAAVALAATGKIGRGTSAAQFKTAILAELADRASSRDVTTEAAEAYHDLAAAMVLAPSDEQLSAGAQLVLRRMFAQAKAYEQSENYELARTVYEALIRCTRSDIRILLSFGRLLMRVRDWEGALDVWDMLLARDPTHLEASIQRARSLDRVNDFVEARAAWAGVAERSPENPEARTALERVSARMLRASRAAADEERFAASWQLLTASRDGVSDEEYRVHAERLARLALRSTRSAFRDRRYHKVVALAAICAEVLREFREFHELAAKASTLVGQHSSAAQSYRHLLRLDPTAESETRIKLAKSVRLMNVAPSGSTVTPGAILPESVHIAEARLALQDINMPRSAVRLSHQQ